MGALAWLVACRAGREIEGIKLRVLPGLVWWLVVWQMLDWHLGMAEGGGGHPRTALSPADAVSLARFTNGRPEAGWGGTRRELTVSQPAPCFVLGGVRGRVGCAR